jgi:putative membrane protein
MNDAEIAAIVVAANTADIDNGKEAQSKSKNADVKMLGRQMVNDHSASNRQADSLAKSLSLNPQESETSRGMKAQQDSIRGEIKKLNGAAYDKAYVDNEVTFHETVLNALDQTLIPNAQNAQLKDLLQNTRPIIAAHLEHARQVQSKLGASASR